jgi:hypothetical protein
LVVVVVIVVNVVVGDVSMFNAEDRGNIYKQFPIETSKTDHYRASMDRLICIRNRSL